MFFVGCTDNFMEFDTVIHARFSQTEIQNCIIHQAVVDEQVATSLGSAETRNTRKSPGPEETTGQI